MVLVDGLVARQLNQSVFQPIAAHFPAVRFSNFAHSYVICTWLAVCFLCHGVD